MRPSAGRAWLFSVSSLTSASAHCAVPSFSGSVTCDVPRGKPTRGVGGCGRWAHPVSVVHGPIAPFSPLVCGVLRGTPRVATHAGSFHSFVGVNVCIRWQQIIEYVRVVAVARSSGAGSYWQAQAG